MLSGLRLRLTLLYLAMALALILLIGIGTYLIARAYFQSTTDLALQHKMAHEFVLLGAPLPPDLVAADRDWSILRTGLHPAIAESLRATPHEDGEQEESRPARRDDEARALDIAYDGELAAIFVLPLSAEGRLLFDPNPIAPSPIAPDQEAVKAALERGSDLRTVQSSRGVSIRLLTYRLTRSDGPAVLQLGRTLADQTRVLEQLVLGLMALGGSSALLMAGGSWWLAGRSLRPAQRAWAQQQAFISNASHELRTPLTLMHASAEVLLRHTPADNTGHRELIGDILQECQHMNRLVDDLLLLSRLDAGRLQLARQPIPLAPLLSDIQRQVGRIANERGIAVQTQVDGTAVWGDPVRLRQVLLILLDNALRHTPAGGTIQLKACDGGRTTCVQVIDTGEGIAPEHLPHLFERFYRADQARSSASGGTGLGLAIAKALTEAQHGRIQIESQPGRGTCVTVTLPAVRAHEQKGQPGEGGGDGKR